MDEFSDDDRFKFKEFPSREDLIEAAAELLYEWLDELPEEAEHDPPYNIALAGGSTPVPVYEKLAQKALEWDSLEFFPTDERCVSSDHPRSNIGMLRRALGSDKKIVPLVEGKNMCTSAAPDIVLLGAGADGHIASLFPDSPLDLENFKKSPARIDTPAVLRVKPASQPEERLTLPLSNLVWANQLLLLICSRDKLNMLLNTTRGKTKTPLSNLLDGRQQAEASEIDNTVIYYAD